MSARYVLASFVALGSLILAGCESPGAPVSFGGPGSGTSNSKVTLVVVNAPSARLMVGSGMPMSAHAYDAQGNPVNKTVSWVSSDSTIATVGSSGTVTAKKVGSVKIVAVVDGTTGSADLQITPNTAATVILQPSSVNLSIGGTYQLSGVALNVDGDTIPDRPLTWTSSNNNIVVVSASGYITAVGSGSATISGQLDGKSDQTSVVVAPAAVDSVALAPANASIVSGSSVQLAVTLRDAQGNLLSGRSITWSSDNTSAATVSSSGRVTGVAAGVANIWATAEGKKGKSKVTVTALPPQVASVSVTPTQATINVGATSQLAAAALDGSGNTLSGRTFTWATSNAAVATVSSNGLVTAVATGSATITATSGGQSGTAAVTVVSPPPTVASVSVSPNTATMLPGNTVTLSATAKDGSGNTISSSTFTWSSSNVSVATVSSSGLVTAVSAGTATITASTSGKSGTAAITVNLSPVASVTLTPTSANLITGDTLRFTATLKDAAGNTLTGRSITWTSSNTGNATISSSGKLTALDSGSATITATSEGQSATASVTITLAPVASVVIAPTTASIAVGGTQQFSVTLKDARGNTLLGRQITWSSSATSVATISNAGLASGLTAGTSTITVASEGKSATATLTVTAAPPPPPTGSHTGWYVSPSGSSGGNGSSSSPWDLQTALNQPGSVHAGDTIWMRAGTYKGTFTSYLTGSPGNPIVLRQYPGEHATVDIEANAWSIQGSDAVYMDFEVTDLNTSRESAITGPWPDDQPRHLIDFDMVGPRTKAINLIVHDLGNGMGVWDQATDVEVNGCLVYNNGWDGPDRGHGHAIYTQNTTGTKKFIDNILLTSFDHGLQAYGSDAASVVNMVFDGNAAYANGGLDIGGAWNMLVGGSAPTQNITFTNNYAFHPNTVTSAVVGYYGTDNSNLTMTGNYIYPALLLENWSPPVTFANNVIGGTGTILNVYQKSGVSWSSFNFSNNTYMSSEANNPPFAITSGGNQTNYEWSAWRSTTGLDASSSYTQGTPTGTKVLVRPNQYEKGRANIYVVNFNHAGSVTADLSAVLTPGQKFELHNAFNYFAAPVVSGTYNGGAITIPISPQVPVAAIGGSPATPPPSDIFSVWIVIPTS
ncbi:MAG TPA: Ig-like domain-containing protein [Gemmatimonadaceae bacterium]|nr:Ig-like domain-containing protein [Gemmatimonadaceae bacterium]